MWSEEWDLPAPRLASRCPNNAGAKCSCPERTPLEQMTSAAIVARGETLTVQSGDFVSDDTVSRWGRQLAENGRLVRVVDRMGYRWIPNPSVQIAASASDSVEYHFRDLRQNDPTLRSLEDGLF